MRLRLSILGLFITFAAFACCLSLPAQDITSAWFAGGKFLAESDSQRMTNDFGGRLDFTADPDFLNGWRQHWNSISTIKHPQGAYIVLFVATKYDSEAQDCVYDLAIKKPDGSVCISFTNLPAVKQPLPPVKHLADAKPTLRLSPKFVVFQLDPPDPVGTYTVEVELRDRLHKTSVKLKKELLVNK
ncbi:MAG: hypothetical protein P4N60_23325 [Verrucomicrobiae bacterium]|nr:hypothetical protein [Verrucomicrobiae bacterium]